VGRAGRALPLLLALLLALASHSAAAERLHAGFGATPLPTPEAGPLAGYGGLFTRSATGVLNPPEARALVVERGARRLAIVAVDLVIVRPPLRDALRAAARERGVEILLVAATHTHSGPGGYMTGWLPRFTTAGRHLPGAAQAIATAAIRALGEAIADLHPVRFGSGRASLTLAENRRRAGGPSETELPLLVFRSGQPEHGPIVLFSYGAHATVLSPASRDYSSDYLGPAHAALQQAGWRSVFLAGPLGDQRPTSRLGPLWPEDLQAQRAQAREVGEVLASAVLAAASAIEATQPDPRIAGAERWIDRPELQLRRFCPLWWAGPLVRGAASRFFAGKLLIQTLRIGDATLAGVPAEPTTRVGEAIRAKLAEARVPFVIAHANAWAGYVVTPSTYRRGGYEACMSFHGDGFADRLTDEVERTLRLLAVD